MKRDRVASRLRVNLNIPYAMYNRITSQQPLSLLHAYLPDLSVKFTTDSTDILDILLSNTTHHCLVGVTPRVFAQRQIVLMTHLITPINHLEDLRSTLGQSPSSKPLLFP
jgi:hypothetical protein